MTRADTQAKIVEVGLIPVIRATSKAQAVAAVAAIRDGGVPIVEITMTIPSAIDVIRDVCSRFGSSVLVGAGTVLNEKIAADCIAAGAEFIVSPAADIATIRLVREAEKVVIPGALTPTEVLSAWNAGADFVKIFPCGNVGGPKYIKALRAPFPDMLFIPTGGVNLDTAADFIRAGAAALGAGADLVDGRALARGDFEVVTANTRKFAEAVAFARGECLSLAGAGI